MEVPGKKGRGSLFTYLPAIIPYLFLLALVWGCYLIYTDIFPMAEGWEDLFFPVSGGGAGLYAVYLLRERNARSKERVRKNKFAGIWTAHLCSAVCFSFGYAVYRVPVHRGLLLIGNEYIEQCNYYYDTQIPSFPAEWISDGGKQAAVVFFLLLIFWWELFALFRLKRAWAPAVPAVLFISAELLIGRSPGFTSIAWTLISLLGLLPVCRRGSDIPARMKPALFTGLLGLCCVVPASLFTKGWAEKQIERQPELLAFQKDLEAKAVDAALAVFARHESGYISNREPEYTEKTVMQLLADRRPEHSVYLRGFVGITYENGRWLDSGGAAFEEMVGGWPEDYRADAGMYIQNLPYTSGESGGWPGDEQTDFSIRYLDTPEDFAYLPYFSDLGSLKGKDGQPKNVRLTGDEAVYRDGEEWLTVCGFVNNSTLGRLAFMREGDDAREALYGSDLSRFLEVPDNLTKIGALGEELSAGMYESDEAYPDRIGGTDEAHHVLKAVSIVRHKLYSGTSYSLSLNPVPMGEDIVEHFLFTSQRGFCQHYASAGTLLLRKMGIPARYASGYMISAEEFRENEDREGKYLAGVRDSDAHAWVEIYIAGTGWVPVEMTKGQDEQSASEAGNPQNDLIPDDSDGSREQSPAAEDNKQNKIGKEENIQLKDLNTPDKGRNEGNLSENGSGRSGTGNQEEENPGNPGWAGLFTGGLFLACFAAAAVKRKFGPAAAWFICHGDRIKLEEANKRRVRSAANRIYRVMRRKGQIGGKAAGDRIFYDGLKQICGDLPETETDRFIEICERAAFGNEPVTVEEAVFCEQMYRKLKLLK